MTKEEYNLWSDSYDSDNNPTRDLDHLIVRQSIHRYKDKKIIEIGCGTGKNTILLSEVASQVQAIDFSEGMLEKAKIKLKDKNNVRFFSADITEKWPFTKSSNDVILCSLVLEHIENLDFIFSEANRVLVASGEFFINEFHPYYQYQGKKPNFQKNGKRFEIESYIHDISEFINSALNNNFELRRIDEWRENKQDLIPRLISIIFKKKKLKKTERMMKRNGRKP